MSVCFVCVEKCGFFGRYFRLTREPGVSRIFRIRGIWEKNVLYQFLVSDRRKRPASLARRLVQISVSFGEFSAFEKDPTRLKFKPPSLHRN